MCQANVFRFLLVFVPSPIIAHLGPPLQVEEEFSFLSNPLLVSLLTHVGISKGCFLLSTWLMGQFGVPVAIPLLWHNALAGTWPIVLVSLDSSLSPPPPSPFFDTAVGPFRTILHISQVESIGESE